MMNQNIDAIWDSPAESLGAWGAREGGRAGVLEASKWVTNMPRVQSLEGRLGVSTGQARWERLGLRLRGIGWVRANLGPPQALASGAVGASLWEIA